MKRIKRPLVLIAIILICSSIIYDILVPEERLPYLGKDITLSGIVTDISRYNPTFGGAVCRLQLENGPPSISKFVVSIKENDISADTVKNVNGDLEMLYGRRVLCTGTFENFEEATNPGQFDKKAYYKNKGFSGNLKGKQLVLTKQSTIERVSQLVAINLHKLNRLVSKKYKKILGEVNAGTLSAMVLGDKSALDEEIKTLYMENSISHLLSISGLHISLVGGAIYLFLKKLKAGFKISLISASLMLILYGLFTEFSVSTSRAVAMMSIFFLSLLLGRSYDVLSAMSLSAICLIIINHRVIYQGSFQLSFMAVVGIFCVMPELNHIFNIKYPEKNLASKIKYFIISSIICSISINITTVPIILFNFYEISISGLFLNIIVIPLMSLLVITGILGGFIAILSEFLGGFILGSSYFILEFYTFLCKTAQTLNTSRFIFGSPSKVQIFIYYVFITILFFMLSKLRRYEKLEELKLKKSKNLINRKKILLVISIITVSTVALTFKKDKFSINMLDIGQGDGFVINTGNNGVYISDCGSTSIKNVGKYRLVPFLKYNACNRIKGIFVSHMDKDHVNGILELLNYKEIKVDKIIISINYKDEILNCKELEELKRLANLRKIKIYYFKEGDKIQDGKLKFLSLYPDGKEVIENPNEASIVMRMEYEGISVLFTGDIGAMSEEKIISEIKPEYLKCDILKVCHHGSKNSSTTEFLNKVNPKKYLISCGLMNRYGHPHKDALKRMAEEGGKIYRSDHFGYVKMTIENGIVKTKYSPKDLRGKKIIKSIECDCDSCRKINTHLK